MGKMELRGEYARMLPRLRPDRLAHELLVRAAKVKPAGDRPLRAVDATAGLGEDALLLAAAGFSVRLFERNAVIAALLRDAMERASLIPELAETVSRMRVSEADSVDALRSLDFEPDVVLLDPMFPQKGKDAAAKKKLQMLQQLECPCDDEEALFEATIAAGTPRLLEHNAIAWITPAEIPNYEFCPADEEILARIRAERSEK